MLNCKNSVTEKHNYLFLLQVKVHVVFGGSNIFELQLNLHGVSCNLKLLWKSWLGNPIYKNQISVVAVFKMNYYIGIHICQIILGFVFFKVVLDLKLIC